MNDILTSDFKELRVWQYSMDIAVEIYELIKLLPHEERFAMADQIRRSTISIPSNIAEGQARKSDKEFLRFLSISRGSIAELSTQLILCDRLGYFDSDTISDKIIKLKIIDKMIAGLMKSIYSAAQKAQQ